MGMQPLPVLFLIGRSVGGSMSTIAASVTVEQFLARPQPEDGHFEELIDGAVIVSPNAKIIHTELVGRLMEFLQPLRQQGFVVRGELACFLEEGSLPNPDLAVIRRDRWQESLQGDWFRQAPDLTVEVLSPGNRKMVRKADLYLQHGAEQVWLVDAKRKTITVFTNEEVAEARLGESVEFHGCTVSVAALFEGL
jgi:Uma2 family endonuclease